MYMAMGHRQVKSAKAEAELPEFDLGKKVGRKIGLQRQRRAVVLCVVDAADFDGSLPRSALQGLFSNIEGYQVQQVTLCELLHQRDKGTCAILPWWSKRTEHSCDTVKHCRLPLLPLGSDPYGCDEAEHSMQVEQGQDDFRREGDKDVRFVLAVNKADLLPSQATQSRLEVLCRSIPIAFAMLLALLPFQWRQKYASSLLKNIRQSKPSNLASFLRAFLLCFEEHRKELSILHRMLLDQ